MAVSLTNLMESQRDQIRRQIFRKCLLYIFANVYVRGTNCCTIMANKCMFSNCIFSEHLTMGHVDCTCYGILAPDAHSLSTHSSQ